MIDRDPREGSVRTLARRALLAIAPAIVGAAALPAAEPAAEANRTAAAAPCDPGGLAPLLTPGRILLLGEIHGSAEGPAVVAAVACAALGRSLPVAVALEIPAEEDGRLQRFLASDGAPEDRARLLAGGFWQRDYQDGRSSRAMLELLDDLRRFARAGGPLTVSLLDSTRAFASGQERDDEMAQRLVELAERALPTTLVVSLTGNIHSRSTAGTPWSADYRPAGLAVASRWPERELSVLLVNPPGTAWTCTDATAGSCGSRSLGGNGDREGGRAELFAAPREGHAARFHLPALSASPPARGER